MENLILIFNGISVLVLLASIGFIWMYYKKSVYKPILVFAFSLLVVVTVTNIFEHKGITLYFDRFEDMLELLFLPFLIFGIYTNVLSAELNERIINEEKFKAIYAHDVSLLWLLDLNGKVLDLNESAMEFFKLTRKQNILNQPFLNLWFNVSNLVEIQLSIDKALEGKKNDIEIEIETPYKQKHIFELVFIPVFKKGRKIFNILVEGRDITLQKEAGRTLEEYNTKLTRIVKEKTEELEAANEELQSLNEELRQQNEILSEKNDEIERLLTDLKQKNEELRKSNTEIRVKESELRKALDELNKTQSQMLQNEKLASIGMLTAGLAHEINNPVNYINSGLSGLKISLGDMSAYFYEMEKFFSLMKECPQIDELKAIGIKYNIKENLEVIEKLTANIEIGVNRTIDLVNSLRFFIRSESNKFEFSNINEIISHVLKLLFHHYKGRIEMKWEEVALPPVWCIPGKINQVLTNLILNAIQAIEKDGVISITTNYYQATDLLSIEISDTGCGIDEKNKEKLFDPFFTTKPAGKGTGLGLTISYSIIKEHKGEILVKSKKGEGSVFTIILPCNTSKRNDGGTES